MKKPVAHIRPLCVFSTFYKLRNFLSYAFKFILCVQFYLKLAHPQPSNIVWNKRETKNSSQVLHYDLNIVISIVTSHNIFTHSGVINMK